MINGYYVIDTHCHIYPEKIAKKAVAATDSFYGAASFGEGTVKNLTSVCRESGVDHAIVQSVATSPHQVKSINEFIASEVQKSNGFLTGLGTLHPDSEDLEGDIRHIIELGLKGVKLHPDIQNFQIDTENCSGYTKFVKEKSLLCLFIPVIIAMITQTPTEF